MVLRYLPLAIKNSLRNRRRSVLTISSVAASMCLLGVLFALYQALFLATPVAGAALRLVTYHRVSLAQALPASYEAKIRQVPGVHEVTIYQWFGGVYRDARDQRNFFARFSVEPDKLFSVHPQLEISEDQKRAFLHNRTGAIADQDLAAKFGWKPGEKITLAGDIFPVTLELTLVGTVKDPEKAESLFFNHEYLRESLGNSPRKDQVGSFSVRAVDEAAANRIGPEIDKLFENAPEPTKTESEAAFTLQFLSFLGNVKLFLIAICGAVTFTILLVSANTMAMSVRERIGEVGVLKTLGYPNSAILAIILGEAGIISLMGGILGLLAAGGMVFLVRAGAQGFQQVKLMSISPALGGLCLVLAVLIGVASALIPATGASRTSILDALRNTG
jgi:putative ABC transport system permease protein